MSSPAAERHSKASAQFLHEVKAFQQTEHKHIGQIYTVDVHPFIQMM